MLHVVPDRLIYRPNMQLEDIVDLFTQELELLTDDPTWALDGKWRREICKFDTNTKSIAIIYSVSL